jgi:hypothetical protein
VAHSAACRVAGTGSVGFCISATCGKASPCVMQCCVAVRWKTSSCCALHLRRCIRVNRLALCMLLACSGCIAFGHMLQPASLCKPDKRAAHTDHTSMQTAQQPSGPSQTSNSEANTQPRSGGARICWFVSSGWGSANRGVYTSHGSSIGNSNHAASRVLTTATLCSAPGLFGCVTGSAVCMCCWALNGSVWHTPAQQVTLFFS